MGLQERLRSDPQGVFAEWELTFGSVLGERTPEAEQAYHALESAVIESGVDRAAFYTRFPRPAGVGDVTHPDIVARIEARTVEYREWDERCAREKAEWEARFEQWTWEMMRSNPRGVLATKSDPFVWVLEKYRELIQLTNGDPENKRFLVPKGEWEWRKINPDHQFKIQFIGTLGTCVASGYVGETLFIDEFTRLHRAHDVPLGNQVETLFWRIRERKRDTSTDDVDVTPVMDIVRRAKEAGEAAARGEPPKERVVVKAPSRTSLEIARDNVERLRAKRDQKYRITWFDKVMGFVMWPFEHPYLSVFLFLVVVTNYISYRQGVGLFRR